MVFEQDPQPGDRIERGNFVTIVVSTGPKKVQCRTSSAESRDSAVAALTSAGLKPNVVAVNSLRPVEHRARNGSEGRHRGDRGHDRAHQRLQGTEAGHGPERDRLARSRRPSRRSRASASRSQRRTWRTPRCGDRRRAEPGRRHAAGQGLRDHAPGLPGPGDLAGPGRDEPDRGRAPRPAADVRLRGAGGRGDRQRREPGREGALAGSGRRDGRGGGDDGGDRRRPLRGGAAARATTADHDHPLP